MTTEKEKTLFRIRFYQDESIYEIYAKSLGQDAMPGFLDVEDIVFSRKENSLIVNTEEERLKQEFEGVVCAYIPMHAVIRIDEVEVEGEAKIIPLSSGKDNVIRTVSFKKSEL